MENAHSERNLDLLNFLYYDNARSEESRADEASAAGGNLDHNLVTDQKHKVRDCT